MFLKIIFTTCLLFGLLSPSIILAAATDAAPSVNPLCWDKKDCIEARSRLMVGSSQKDIDDGWVQETPCVGGAGNIKWGKCLAAGRTVTEISFGGQNTFAHLGEFIKVLYNYALRIASIVAVVVIIIAGFQWVSSGGNSEAINSAKKRIGGAMMGLFIAALSYFILEAINPALLSLRLPQVWMIKTMKLPPEFCFDKLKPGETSFPPADLHAYAGEQGDEVKTDESTKYDKQLAWDFKCGSQYLPSGGAACYGHYCSANQVCTKFDEEKNKKKPYVCRDGYLAGKIYGFGDTLNIKTVDGPIKLLALCADGTVKKVDEIKDSLPDIDQAKKPPQYIFSGGRRDFKAVCGSFGPPKFFLAPEINDEAGGLGAAMEGAPISYGCDDWFAVGRVGKGSHECSVNLARVANKIVNAFPGVDCQKKFDVNACSCAFTAFTDMTGALYEDKGADGYFITAEELERGFICDLNISRSEFPSMDNTNNWLCSYAKTVGVGMAVGTAGIGAAPAALGTGAVCGVSAATECLSDDVKGTACGGGTSLLPSEQKSGDVRNLK